MNHRCLLTGMAVLCLAWSSCAAALAFRSVKETGTLLYEAPVLSAKKLFVVSRDYPVEVLNTEDNWARVRDATGGISWIPQARLSTRRTLLVISDRAVVRIGPSADATAAFTVLKNSVLQWVAAPVNGWVKIRHRDGASGYIRISELWGL